MNPAIYNQSGSLHLTLLLDGTLTVVAGRGSGELAVGEHACEQVFLEGVFREISICSAFCDRPSDSLSGP